MINLTRSQSLSARLTGKVRRGGFGKSEGVLTGTRLVTFAGHLHRSDLLRDRRPPPEAAERRHNHSYSLRDLRRGNVRRLAQMSCGRRSPDGAMRSRPLSSLWRSAAYARPAQDDRPEKNTGNRRKCLVRPQGLRGNGEAFRISDPTVPYIVAEHRHNLEKSHADQPLSQGADEIPRPR